MPPADKKKSSLPAKPAVEAKAGPPKRPLSAPATDQLGSTAPFSPALLTNAIHSPHASTDTPVEVLRSLIERHLVSTLARHPSSATPRDWWVATALAVRDTIHERMIATQAVHNAENVRRIYYFSLEYLMGRLMGNNLLATGLLETAQAALTSLGQ